jgi:Ni,Fe-hydrogenase III small subunit/NAD-dependent dihydropyrimidine dehydrogenase PreA subunit
MHNVLWLRLRQKTATVDLPVPPESLPARMRGLPVLEPERCPDGCRACAEACPTQAIEVAPLALDLGRCVFCMECVRACPADAIRFTRDYRMAARRRNQLVVGRDHELAEALGGKLQAMFGRSLRLRAVCAGSCNGCDAELVALGNVVFDLGRYGIQFVASPRHADGLVVTGPVTRNMDRALRETYEAVPEPRIVIAVGACALSGGPFRESPEQRGGADQVLPVDLYVPGCPPHPLTILDGLLRLLGRIETGDRGRRASEGA